MKRVWRRLRIAFFRGGPASEAGTRAACGLLLLAGFAAQALGAPGKSGANYLKIDAGAKAVAMGGTQFSADDDAFAPFYNPSLFSDISQKEIAFMHNEFIEDLRQEVLSTVIPTSKRGNFAVGFDYFTYGQIAGYDATGAPTGDLSASDFMMSGSWAKHWDFVVGEQRVQNLATGVTLKLLNRKLHDESATGAAADLGMNYAFRNRFLKDLRFGAALSNFGSKLKSSELPRSIRFGLRYTHWGDALLVTLDQIAPADGSSYPAFGAQYKVMKMFAVRLGYKANPAIDNRLTYGVGFENPIFRLDYAFIPFGELGDTHRISVHYRFGRNTKRPTADSQLQEKVNEAKSLYAQGLLVDAYLAAVQVQHVAPWLDENNRLLERIQKNFKELEESDKKEKLKTQIAALFSRGEKFFEEGNLINARLEFQAVLGLQPDHKAAQGYLRQIEGQFRSFVESFYRAGMLAFASEDFIKAKQEFEKVLTIKPDHTEAKAQLERCNEILEKKQKQQEELEKKDEVSRVHRDAMAAYREGNHEKAVQLFREVLRMDPRNQEAQRYLASSNETLFKRYLDRGREFAGRGEWESAVKNLKGALEINPSSKDTRTLLQDVERRWDLQRKVLSENLYKEGLEAFLQGDKKKAKDIWERAVNLDPENQEAKRGLARIAQ